VTTSTCERSGCSVAYRVRGDGPPVLFVQGVGVHGDGWAPQTDALSSSYRCLSFDNRGMGASLPAPRACTIAELADDAVALADAQGWDRFHVVGHSMGGLIALQLALSAHDRVRSLALLCTAASGPYLAMPSWRAAWIGLRSKVGTLRARRRAFLEIVAPKGSIPVDEQDALCARLADVFGHDLAVTPSIVFAQLAAMRACDVTPRLPELAGIPTLVASARHDPIAPPVVGRALADGIPGARYVQWDDAAHGVVVTHADRVNALLAAHLADA
jgi:pimeloyl-ACP methyl ester carboxylesterase